jgi:hypothetical protein
MKMSQINQKTEQIYKNIMERLIIEIKEDALNEGCNEDMLKELKGVSII